MARQIRVFDAGGRFVSAFGQPGSGPGELSSPSAVLIAGGDTILVPDVVNGRVQRFLTDGSPAGHSPMDLARGFPLSWATRDGLLLEELRPHPSSTGGEAPPALVLLRDGGGQVVDTLLEMEESGALEYRNGMAHMVAFSPEPRWTLLEDGRLASGRLSAYRVEIRDRNGRLERVVTKSFERRPLRDSDRQALRERIRGFNGRGPPSAEREHMIRTMEFGTHFPAFASLFGGPDGTLWVQKALQASTFEPHEMASFGLHAIAAPEYDIFDHEGRYLGTMTPPGGLRPGDSPRGAPLRRPARRSRPAVRRAAAGRAVNSPVTTVRAMGATSISSAMKMKLCESLATILGAMAIFMVAVELRLGCPLPCTPYTPTRPALPSLRQSSRYGDPMRAGPSNPSLSSKSAP